MSDIYRYTDSLEHHGIKGMKWGVRNNRSQSRAERKIARRERSVERGRTAVRDKSGGSVKRAYATRAGKTFVKQMALGSMSLVPISNPTAAMGLKFIQGGASYYSAGRDISRAVDIHRYSKTTKK